MHALTVQSGVYIAKSVLEYVSNNYLTVAGVVSFIVWLFYRNKIARYCRGVFGAFINSKKTFDDLQATQQRLADEKKRADDNKTILEDFKERYEAFKEEYEAHKLAADTRLRELDRELEVFQQKMQTAEDLNRLLARDRDEMIAYSQRLIGQLFILGIQPEAPYPKLQSVIAVPVPTVPPPPGSK